MNLFEKARQFLGQRRTAYVKTFLNPYGDEVLRDLARFCRAHAVAEGRREVWLRIQQHLQLSDDELWAIFGQSSQPIRKPEE